MKSLKQDLVGFHWSAFFEPRLPFTRVPVKLPLPHLLSLYLSLSISLSFYLSLSLCLALSPPLPSHLSAHLPTLQCTYCQLAMVTPVSPCPFFTSSLPCDLCPLPSWPLYSFTFCHHAGWAVAASPTPPFSYTPLHPHPLTPDVNY